MANQIAVSKAWRNGRLVVLAVAGIGLILTACLGFVFWRYVAMPVMRSVAPEFDPQRSMLGIWADTESGTRWDIWGHDTAFTVGKFGDASWAASLAAKVKSGEGIGCLGGRHLDSALCLLTNHAPPAGSDKQAIAQFWGEWWEDHGHLSQEDWLRLGFEKAGLVLRQPPSKEDWPALLALLGEVQRPGESDFDVEEAPQIENAPAYLRYNAYRWLRDFGFEPVAFLVEESEQISTPEKNGLLEYQRWEQQFRTAMPGRLAFAPTDDWGWGMGEHRKPWGLQPTGQMIVHLALGLVLALGIALLWAVKKLRARPTTDCF